MHSILANQPDCTKITDEDVDAMARKALSAVGHDARAMRNKFIAWIVPFRKDGVIDIPWDFQKNSCEAVMVSDGTAAGIPNGTRIMVRPDEGILHEVNGVELCFMPASALMMVVEK